MKILRKWGVLTALLIVAFLAIPMSPASAVPIVPVLKLSDGTTTVTVSDGGPGDINPFAGSITYLGSIGSWILNVSTGITKPILGDASNPQMDLSSVNVSSFSGGTLTIGFVDGDFIASPPGDSIGTSIGGTIASNGSLTFASYYYDSNATDFIGGNLISSLSFLSGSFSGDGGGYISPASSLFSLSEVVTITHRGAGATSFDAVVPEPGTLFLLGSGLLGFVFLRRSI